MFICGFLRSCIFMGAMYSLFHGFWQSFVTIGRSSSSSDHELSIKIRKIVRSPSSFGRSVFNTLGRNNLAVKRKDICHCMYIRGSRSSTSYLTAVFYISRIFHCVYQLLTCTLPSREQFFKSDYFFDVGFANI